VRRSRPASIIAAARSAGAPAKKKKKKPLGRTVVASNKRATFQYEIVRK